MPKLSLEKWASLVVIVAGGAGVLFLGVKYLFPALLPFLLAWGFAFLLRPLSCALAKRFHISRKVSAVAANLVSVGVVFFVLYILLRQLFLEGQALLSWLKNNPHRISAFFEEINRLLARFRFLFPHLGEGEEALSTAVQNLLQGTVESALTRLPQLVGALFGRLPGILLFVCVTLIASVYFALDLEKINGAVLSLFPPKWADRLKRIKAGMMKTGFAYLRAYLLLMGLTFVMLLVAFWLARIPYALLLSFLFALVDVLPVLGVGTMLVPWGLFCLLFGQTGRGVFLLVLYAVILVVRQFAEPKIVGARLGIPPLMTLVYLYAGVVIFGFWGILLGPILGALLHSNRHLLKKQP